MGESTFDRVRPRVVPPTGGAADPAGTEDEAGAAPGGAASGDARSEARAARTAQESVDLQGKSALFSAEPVTPSLGSVVIKCSGCQAATRTSYLEALVCALPSLHLLVLRPDYPSWMRCPSCGRRRWVQVRFR